MTKWETLKQRAKDLNENYDKEVEAILQEDITKFHKELQALNESGECNIDSNEVLLLGVDIAMERLVRGGKKARAIAKKMQADIKATKKATKND